MYPHQSIEPKWQRYWAEHDTFECLNPELENSHKPKFYALDMFPYPSGAGLHVGHPKGYTATDIIARYKHAKGFHVLHPMGWDAFGLPAENYAIKTGTHPAVTTANNITHFREQLKKFGFSFDWNREVDTTDPEYYKWSQWIFSKLFEAGLAYESDKPINFCPSCKTGLANEEVINGKCERCGTPVEKRPIRQWVLAITKYADRLLSDIDRLDWPEGIKEMQRNWIGRSEGCQFSLKGIDCPDIEVFTTRIDTVYGMTYVVIAPDHPSVASFITPEHEKECLKYIEKTQSESDQDRTNEKKEKTGVFTGSYVMNPYNSEKVPVWIADYVLGNYGTGAVMAVPAHDERDWDFAKKYDLPIRQSVGPFFTNTAGEWSPRSDKKDEERDLILALLKHSTENKYLCLNWKQTDWKSFISGGTEGESLEVAGKREIQEETGYSNIRFVRSLGKQKQYYFAGHKDVNRIGYVEGGLFELIDETRAEVVPQELEKHTPVWIDAENIPAFLNLDTNKHFWNKLIKDSAFTEDGVLVNSGNYNWISSAEGRVQLTEKAEKEGFGKKVTNYKLRDWIFSRQRYWGEPIPLIHISEEAINNLTTLNFRNQEVWGMIQGGEKKIETRSLNHEEPGRYFENIKSDNIVMFSHFETKEKMLVKIKKVILWKNLHFLSESMKEYPEEKFGHKIFVEDKVFSEKELQEKYNALIDGYADKIEKNGLIGFEFEVLGKLYSGIDSWILPDYTLPLKLPEVEKYEPSGDGQSPLATIPDWVNVRLGNNLVGKRETNTMPQWAGSCWYYLRYMDPTNSDAIVDPAVVKYWGEVDSYIGGAEHAVLHLLYARFWHKFLFDIGVVPSDEPFFKLRNVGLILGPDGEKMSKSRGNVVNPDDVIEEYGADTLRMYEMSMSDFSDVSPWNTKAIIGNYRLLEKIHRLFTTDETSEEFKAFLATSDMKAVKTMHKCIKKVGEDIENMKFNTAISMLNVMMNEGAPADAETRAEWKSALVRLLHPFAPHMAEECWSLMGNEDSIYETEWPEYIEALTIDDEVMIAVQINGKLRGTYPFMRGVTADEVRMTIEGKPEIAKWLEGVTILKEIFIPNKILNIVIKND